MKNTIPFALPCSFRIDVGADGVLRVSPIQDVDAVDDPADDIEDENEVLKEQIFQAVERSVAQIKNIRIDIRARRLLLCQTLDICRSAMSSVDNAVLANLSKISSGQVSRWFALALRAGFLIKIGPPTRPAYCVASVYLRMIQKNKNRVRHSRR